MTTGINLAVLLFTGFTLGITGAMIPGPLTFFTMSETLKTDGFAGLKVISGHILLEFIIVGLIFLGLERFFTSGNFLSTISIVGGSALILMGIFLLSNARSMKLLSRNRNPAFNKGQFIGGIFFSAVSPGFLVWWATIGVSTVIKALLWGMAGVLFLILGHWLADILWYWLVSYAVDRGKTYLNNGTYRNIIRFFSCLLVILGLYFLFFQKSTPYL